MLKKTGVVAAATAGIMLIGAPAFAQGDQIVPPSHGHGSGSLISINHVLDHSNVCPNINIQSLGLLPITRPLAQLVTPDHGEALSGPSGVTQVTHCVGLWHNNFSFKNKSTKNTKNVKNLKKVYPVDP